MNKPFIEQLCDEIFAQLKSGTIPLLVLPNKRPIAYIKKYLHSKNDGASWFPKIVTIEEYVLQLSGLVLADPLEIATRFFKIYNHVLQDQAKPFDDFIKWWNLIVGDFNDVDMYMINTNELFNYISDAKAIETWNPGQSEPTELQKSYLKFWKYLPLFYNQLKADLLSEGKVYRGLAYRRAAELAQKKELMIAEQTVIFAGFNALSTSEELLIEYFLTEQKGFIYWEADNYYLNDTAQEAGKFLRYYQTHWKKYPNSIILSSNNLSTNKIDIKITGAPKGIMQATYAGACLQNYLGEGHSKTALVPADETLLIPLLYQLPTQNGADINISMGYPMELLPLKSLVELLFSFAERSSKQDPYWFKTSMLIELLSHSHSAYLFGKTNLSDASREINMLGQELLKSGKTGYSQQELMSLVQSYETINMALLTHELPLLQKSSKALFMWLKNIFSTLLNSSLVLSQNIELLHTQISVYISALQKLEQFLVIDKESITNDFKTIHSLFIQQVEGNSIPFIGDPTGSFQLIGLLETRMLQFDELIITSCNEGILPGAKAMGNSFIPFDIRMYYKLPTYKDSEAVFAYHFYRLLQGAKTAELIYNTETDEFGSGEKSRFLLQLETELMKVNPNATVTHHIAPLPSLNLQSRKEISFMHQPHTLEKLKAISEKGFSASALITFKNCKLSYYFRYLEGIKEPDEIAEETGAHTAGSIIHAVLENIYKPFTNQLIKADSIVLNFKEIEHLTKTAFLAIEPGAAIDSGKNLLLIETIVRIIEKYLKWEKQILKFSSLHLIGTEQELKAGFENVQLRGTIDRVDEVDNSIRIIDYKTGYVDSTKLKLKFVGDVFESSEYDKAFQLLFYTLLYTRATAATTKNIEAGIMSMRKINQGLQVLNYEGEADEMMQQFEQQLKLLIAELMNPKTVFNQTENLDICAYCGFASICMR